MLTDADGNVADIEMDADSVIKRMNLAKLYEQYVMRRVLQSLNVFVRWL